MKILRKITAMSMALIICLTSASAFAKNIYDLTEETTIAKGIVLKNIKRLTDKGWININVLEADLSGDRYKVKTLRDTEDITNLVNVKNLAQSHSALGAVNGDFFSWKWDDKSKGSAIGGTIIDGELHSSITSPWNFATVAQNDFGTFIFDYFDCSITATAPNDFVMEIEHINKYDDLTKPIIYTKHWGKTSPGSHGFQSEIVIEDDKVISINYDVGPVEIPENGYIIAFLRDQTPEILENVFVGDEIKMEISCLPEFKNIDFAVGAGTLLLKDGEKAKNTNDIAGYQPRTAIGVSEDNKKLYLVTVDGRQAASKGVTLSHLSDILKEAGAYHAANLDGGGSTTMAVKSPYTNGYQVANSPSDSYLRPVINAVGVVANKKADKNGFITIETDSDYVFNGTSLLLNGKVHDSLGNITDSAVTWNVTGGKVKGDYYIPSGTGTQTLTATHSNMRKTKEIKVLDAPVKLSTGLKEYKIASGDSAYISLIGEDSKGYKAYLNLKDVDITLSSSILSVDGNSIKGVKKGSALATFNFGDVQTSAIIRVGGDTSKITLPEDVTTEDSGEIENGFSFAVFGDTQSKNTLTEKLVLRKYASVLKDTDVTVFAGNTAFLPSEMPCNVITTKDFSTSKFDGATIITLNASYPEQWAKVIDEIKNARTKNIFIVTSKTINDDSEFNEEMLIEIKEKYLENANLCVISPDSYGVLNDSGIKHVQIPGAEMVKGALSVSDDSHFFRITVQGDKFGIEKVKIFN